MKNRFQTHIILLLLAGLTLACEQDQKDASPAQFELLRQEQTGLDFQNVLTQNADFNVFNYMYFYNGGGLAAGDFNKDGLVDLYFTANMSENKLYLNQGDLRFEEATETAGLQGIEGWTTGASIVDINNDGMLDIYVTQMSGFQNIKGKNQLYVCQSIENGIPIFKDEAAEYGLDLEGFGTQAAFFDYDLDGDLDMYQLNHSLHRNGTFGKRKTFENDPHPLAGDRLWRNDGDKFTDVSARAGIYSSAIGYGLGITTGDVNNDGWPDIYIGNDFHENDYLYLNNQNGTFSEVLTEQIRHTSRFSMGVDMSDINNDGWNEIVSLDMHPYDPFILKSSLGEDGLDIFKFKLGYGYNPQFARNNLQLNNGNGTFSEIGIFAGIHATDWSWSPLFFDFDHDGYKDLFISNGIPRRMNDIDYVNFKTNDDLRYKNQFDQLEDTDLTYIEKMPEIKLENKFFKNTQSIRFQDIKAQIDNNTVTYSSSAIYADLDNDGDLEIVVNNIDDEPFVYKNLQIEQQKADVHYLNLRLTGTAQNPNAIGAKAIVFKGDERYTVEYFPTRGYQSSALTDLHLGIGQKEQVDSIVLVWADRTYQNITPNQYDTTLSIVWKANLPQFDFQKLVSSKAQTTEYEDIAANIGLNHKHDENPFVEFHREALIPHTTSAEGPALAVGDVNGDGLEDVFVGGAKRKTAALFLQQSNGKFQQKTPNSILQDSIAEDVNAIFVDIEKDGDLDLIVASGGNEFRGKHEALKQRVYLNNGNGNFERKDLFPNTFMTASCVLPADVNGDGNIDLFFGGRAVPWQYGVVPESYLFINQGDGTFEEKTPDALKKAGLVKDGTWSDIDKDGDLDLIIAAEWQPILIFENENGQLNKTEINDASGWWNTVISGDFDGDGDMDLMAGNSGENTKLKPSKDQPIRLFVNDFDDNDQIEQILTYHIEDREIPFATYAELTKQLVQLKKQFLYAKDFAAASLGDLFGQEKLNTSIVYEANTFQSIFFENQGDGKDFVMHALPDEAQFSTLHAIAPLKNSNQFLLAGNSAQSNIEMGWYDASYGQVLEIEADGKMAIVPTQLNIEGEVRQIQSISIQGEVHYIVARNDKELMVLKADSQKGILE
ncbi:MAG: VCBS repeat-containing protein [Bacteroidota bacterium]